MYKYSDELVNCGLFAGLKREQIWQFLSDYSYKISEYKPNEKLDILNDKMSFVIKGTVVKLYLNSDGTEFQTNIKFQTKDFILCMESQEEFYGIQFRAVTDSIILYLEYDAISKFNESCAVIQNTIMKNMINSFTFSTLKQQILDSFYAQKSVRNKLLKVIEYQKNPPKGFSVFHLTKKELADMLKVDYSSLCREYNKLKAEGMDMNIFFDKEYQ